MTVDSVRRDEKEDFTGDGRGGKREGAHSRRWKVRAANAGAGRRAPMRAPAVPCPSTALSQSRKKADLARH